MRKSFPRLELLTGVPAATQTGTPAVPALVPGAGARRGGPSLKTSHAESPTPPRNTLESIPAELRCLIISYLWRIEDLDALVRASPVFYHQYRLDRKTLLRRLLRAKLGDCLVDVYAVQTSVSLYNASDPKHPPQPEVIRVFFDDYAAWRAATGETILERCTEENLVGMVSFYLSLGKRLFLGFARWFCNHLDPSLELGVPSRTEQTRIFRAMCRFQVYCNLFGAGHQGRRAVAIFEPEEILARFFGTFEPWEVEEIDCIYALVASVYEQVFEAIQWDVSRLHPRSASWVRPHAECPPTTFDLDHECKFIETKTYQPYLPYPTLTALDAR